MNVTLVAYYKTKPPGLSALIQSTQNMLLSEFGPAFTPYSIAQVHATIVGLEHEADGDKYLNSNFIRYRQSNRTMDLAGFVKQLKTALQSPVIIRMGGYTLDTDYGFTSQGQHPMKRSFSIQSDKVVTMGWPMQNAPESQLANLRKCFEQFNILHKWHQHPNDMDNDLYFVLGHLDRARIGNSTIEFVEKKLRNQFATRPPLELELFIEDLQFVAYSDLTLPPDGSYALSLSDADADINKLYKLFDR